MANPWFRVYTEMVDDEKIRLLAFEDRWHYVAILCCKGKGILDSDCDPAMVMRRLSVKLGLTVREMETVLNRLAEVGLVDPETAQPTGWANRQFQSDTSTERVKAYRERMKRSETVSVTAQDTDTDTDKQKKQDQKPLRSPSGSLSLSFDQADFGSWPEPPSRQAYDDLATHRRKTKADLTATVIKAAGREITKAFYGGMTVDECLEVWVLRGWRGFKADWALEQVTRAKPTSTPSKGLSSIMKLENMKNGLDHSGSGNGIAKADLPQIGGPPRR